MLIATKKVGEDVITKEVETLTLEDMQEMVGGLIECFRVADDIDMWINDCGKLDGLPLNMVIAANGEPVDTIQGDAFFASHDGEGGTAGLTEKQVDWIKEKLDTGNWCLLQSDYGIEFVPVWEY